ncbi:MAG: rRNA maturation RNase YbeY [Caulobacteraceae bacterium]|nr:rRNA maturation RNase YbeY [Caulobacteraceae bacterium]
MIRISVEIQEKRWLEALPDAITLARRAGEVATPRRRRGEVTVLLASDGILRELNRRFRCVDQATNVLAFPAPPNARGHLGDVALAFGVCEAEAEAQAKPLADHLRHLVIHGILHLMGYDHQTDAQAETMEGIERHLLATLGVPDPYAAGNDQGDHVQHGSRA